MLTLPGMRLLHEGQLEGFRIRTPVQLVRRPPEAVDSAVQALYEQLLSIVAKSAVGRGKGEVLMPRAAWEDNPTAKWFVLVQWQSASEADCRR